jgi:chromosome segregation ATPase
MRFALAQYPSAIAQASQSVNEIEHRLNDVRQHLAKLEGNAEMVVAFEVGLKNDNQRKARRFEVLQANREYEEALYKLNRLMTDKSHAIAQLEHLRNEFAVAKLETQSAIALKLVGTNARELVGL